MRSSSKIRLAILECDSPLPKTTEKYGGYGGVFKTLLAAGAKAEGFENVDDILSISMHQIESDVDPKYPDIKDIDAVLLTGSRHDAFADPPWIQKLVDYTARCIEEKRVRLIGVCFGHQIVARAMGLKVGRNPKGWEVAVTDVQLSKKGQELFGLDNLRIQMMHRDIVFSCPENFELLGSSPVCKFQGMYSPHHMLTIQGHPEFTADIMKEIVEVRHSTGVFDEEAYNKYSKKVSLPHDGIAVSRAFIRFLLEN